MREHNFVGNEYVPNYDKSPVAPFIVESEDGDDIGREFDTLESAEKAARDAVLETGERHEIVNAYGNSIDAFTLEDLEDE